jgi:hypothetical protein
MITAKQVVQAWGVTRTKSRLLQQVVFWHPQRQITRKDGFWSVLSRKEWAEKSSMSLKQYARSVTELTKMGFIEHRRIWFRGEQMAGLRLTRRSKLRAGGAPQTPIFSREDCEGGPSRARAHTRTRARTRARARARDPGQAGASVEAGDRGLHQAVHAD